MRARANGHRIARKCRTYAKKTSIHTHNLRPPTLRAHAHDYLRFTRGSQRLLMCRRVYAEHANVHAARILRNCAPGHGHDKIIERISVVVCVCVFFALTGFATHSDTVPERDNKCSEFSATPSVRIRVSRRCARRHNIALHTHTHIRLCK